MSPLYFCYFLTTLVSADHVIFGHRPFARAGKEDDCICSIELPDDVFPSQMIDVLQDSHANLTFIVDQEMTKITKINKDAEKFNETLTNVTNIIRDIEKNGIKDQTDYTNIKNMITNLMTTAADITNEMNGTDAKVEEILNKVNNVSSMVWELENFDPNHVLLLHREIAVLRKQLADCEENAINPNFGLPPATLLTPEFGKCENKILVNISKPFVVKVNWKGFNNKYGAWGKDFALGTLKPDMYWLASLNTDERLMERYRIYNSYNDLLLYKNHEENTLSKFVGLTWDYADSGQGSGAILFNGSLYYNCYNTRNVCKLDISTHKIERKKVEGATFNNWFSYRGVNWQDFDFAGDENGLWITYATTKSQGKITIGKLDPETLSVTKTWETTLFKNETTNTFMICGKLYALQRVNTHREKIFYSYDTKSQQDAKLNIVIEKLSGTPQSVGYNPNDHKLYMYNDGYLVTYDVLFRRLRDRRSVSSSEAGQSSIMPFNNIR